MFNAFEIETFLAVVRNQNLSGAAAELFLAQPTISQRIKVMEKKMGSPLIDRHKGVQYIHLTPSGEELLALAERWSVIGREIEMLQAHGPQLSLHIGTVNSFNMFVLPNIYQKLISHSPTIHVESRTLHSDELYSEVGKRQIDVGFVAREGIHPNVIVEKCLDSPFVVLRASADTLQQNKPVHPQELDPSREIHLPYSNLFQAWHDRWWNPLGPRCITVDLISLLATVLTGSYWTILPDWIANLYVNTGAYSSSPLLDAPANFAYYKLTNKYSTPAIKKSLDILDNYLDSILPNLNA